MTLPTAPASTSACWSSAMSEPVHDGDAFRLANATLRFQLSSARLEPGARIYRQALLLQGGPLEELDGFDVGVVIPSQGRQYTRRHLVVDGPTPEDVP